MKTLKFRKNTENNINGRVKVKLYFTRIFDGVNTVEQMASGPHISVGEMVSTLSAHPYALQEKIGINSWINIDNLP